LSQDQTLHESLSCSLYFAFINVDRRGGNIDGSSYSLFSFQGSNFASKSNTIHEAFLMFFHRRACGDKE
ncbi:hypothetical protein, partial [Paenibacillus montaniterrae]|uniref:hypothetical protein n=1 Tax=Paenibacillus montaniterrae TaxID=429341 RepID=UPI001BCB8AC3